MRELTVTVTTAVGGAATEYTPETIHGKVLQISYVKDDFANGVNWAITGETTGVNVWTENPVNASKVVLPRQGVHDVAGAAATLDGTRLMREPVYVGGERLKIVVAAGGDAKVGTFKFLIGDVL